ncbi:hypothetical protein [Primorskyibacter sp. S87]|uniref:hypothetical protein n=1 Tax=Primorskyibacter sp. S87 TaxID=3415126 RepID=UPI003C7B4BDA
MRTGTALLLIAGALHAGPVSAQTQKTQSSPLSVIDWLGQNTAVDLPNTVLLEPPVAPSGAGPSIEVTPLAALAPPLGLVSSQATGLPVDLWLTSDAETLAELIAQVPVRDSPAMQTLLYSLLLSETRPPSQKAAAESLLAARIDRLIALGATDPAQALVQLAGPTNSRDRFSRWFDATLLTGDEDKACAVLAEQPHLARGYADLVFCNARRGDWQTAALLLETAHALELLPPATLDLLDRFLSPDIYEGAPMLPPPSRPDPLTFRLYETIGERLPTASLPRAFATADLRDVAGWKAQIEAAERLTRIGALGPNRLLGLYTERLPAASGGVWDRVEAVQRFDTALASRSGTAIAKTLQPAWDAMRAAGLEVAFAELFFEQLSRQRIPDATAAQLAWEIRLLSRDYEAASRRPPQNTPRIAFLAALAQGNPGRALPPGELAEAISDGFAQGAVVPPNLQDLISSGRLGEAILETMLLFDKGARGNPANLSAALATFRSIGLEDTARRAALQLMILGQE